MLLPKGYVTRQRKSTLTFGENWTIQGRLEQFRYDLGTIRTDTLDTTQSEADEQMTDESRFADTYSRMSSDELKRVMLERDTLVPQAASALEQECAKRGLDETSAKTYQDETAQATEKTKRENEAIRNESLTRRRTMWLQTGIFVGVAILTALLAEYVVGLPSNAVYLLTKMLVNLAIAAIVLSWAFGGRWLTVKRACIAAILLNGGVLIWILLTVSNVQNSRH